MPDTPTDSGQENNGEDTSGNNGDATGAQTTAPATPTTNSTAVSAAGAPALSATSVSQIFPVSERYREALSNSLMVYPDQFLPQVERPSVSSAVSPLDSVLNATLGEPKKVDKAKMRQALTSEGDETVELVRSLVQLVDVIVNKSDYKKVVEVKEEKPPDFSYQGLNVDTTKDSVDEMLGASYRAAQASGDIDPLAKALMKMTTIQRVLLELPNTPDTQVKRKQLYAELDGIDITKVSQDYKNSIINTNLSRSAHIGVERIPTRDVVDPPRLGDTQIVSVTDLKSLSVAVQHRLYGGQHAHRSGTDFLRAIKSTIQRGNYNTASAYQITEYMMTGEYLTFVQNAAKKRKRFETFWVTFANVLQGATRAKAQEAARDLERVLARPPAKNLAHTLLQINNLVALKLETPEYTDFESQQIFNLECKTVIMRYIYAFYLPYMSLIKESYERIVNGPGVDRTKIDTFDVLYNIIMRTIGEAPPTHMGQHRTHVHETEAEPGERPQEETNVEQGFVRRNQPPNAQFGARPRFTIPDHLKGKCLLCKNPNHSYKSCDKYEDRRVSDNECKVCTCKHVGTCRNLRAGIYSGEASEDPQHPQNE